TPEEEETTLVSLSVMKLSCCIQLSETKSPVISVTTQACGNPVGACSLEPGSFPVSMRVISAMLNADVPAWLGAVFQPFKLAPTESESLQALTWMMASSEK